MIITLTWKELREHQGIWLTMVVMSILLGLGLSKLVALNDPSVAVGVGAFTILGMAATYGVVCGSMMLAGEHEGGTLVFLDIFHGRRGRLWLGKCAIGIALALTQSLAVAALLILLQTESPPWIITILGKELPAGGGMGGMMLKPSLWFLVLPVVTVEAFFWGMLGSSWTQRVLTGAALAGAIFTPILLMSLCAPPLVMVVIRIMAVLICLAFSLSNFLIMTHDASPAAPARVEPQWQSARKDQFLEEWDRFERSAQTEEQVLRPDVPVSLPEPFVPGASASPVPRKPMGPEPDADVPDQPRSPLDALWWLTFQQAWPVVTSLAVVGLVLGLILIPVGFQIFWPFATLALGVACGTATFAPEQRDQSYQFLAAQHLPLAQIWRFKISFWLAAGILVGMLMLIGTILLAAPVLLRRQAGNPGTFPGTFFDLLGPTLFLGGWFAYGFTTAQVLVWLCRKTILALMISTLVSLTAIGLWLPSLLCGGMAGWQVWLAPIVTLVATRMLLRAWAGGRIWERKPITALAGFGGGILAWALLCFGYRAFEVPYVGAPLDRTAFKESLPSSKGNSAGLLIQRAISKVGEGDDPWLKPLGEATRLPVGVLEGPRADGQPAVGTHLPACRTMTDLLLVRARNAERRLAFEYLAQILMLSRNLRSKASPESYLVGVDLEQKALLGLDQWLERGKPTPELLRRALDELHRHADETPPLIDCLKAECYRSKGMMENANHWTLSPRDGAGRMAERWLANGIAVSAEIPWEIERKERIWQLAWVGLLHRAETPHWELPTQVVEIHALKSVTRTILREWLPPPDGAAASVTPARLARLLDHSWLADDRMFPTVTPLRQSATRSRVRIDSAVLAVALGLFRLEHGKSAPSLSDLVPRIVLGGVPTDPYSGEVYRYRVNPNDGQEFIWSTGPDRIDHGGRNNGFPAADDAPQWNNGDLDLIKAVPLWR